MKACLALCLAALACTVSAQPGFKTTLTQSGLDYLRTIGVELLQQALSSLKIPDITGSTGTPIGTIDYQLTDIQLTGTNLGTSAIAIVPGSGLALTLSGVGASVHLNWHYKMKDWPHTSDGGSADVKVSSTSASASIAVTDQGGLPYVTCTNAAVNVGHLDIDLHGGASWLYQIFVNVFSGQIQDSIQDALKDAIVQNINDGLNKAIKTLPISEPIDSHVEIDFPLVSNPIFAPGYFSLPTLGEFYQINHHTETPYPRTATPDVITGEMVQMILTEFVAVSAGYVYWQLGELATTITPNDVPANSPFQLNTTYFKFLVPPLYNMYPNMAMQLQLAATQMPSAKFTPSGAAISVYGNMLVQVILPNKTIVDACTLSGPVYLSGVALLNGETIYGNISYLSCNFTVTQTNIGQFSPAQLDAILNFLFSYGIVPQVNKRLAKGFPLPTVTGLTFVNPTVGWGNGYLYVSTNAQYVPPKFDDDASTKPVPLHDPKPVQLNKGHKTPMSIV